MADINLEDLIISSKPNAATQSGAVTGIEAAPATTDDQVVPKTQLDSAIRTLDTDLQAKIETKTTNPNNAPTGGNAILFDTVNPSKLKDFGHALRDDLSASTYLDGSGKYSSSKSIQSYTISDALTLPANELTNGQRFNIYDAGSTLSIATMTRANITVTCTTTSAHGLITPQIILIIGADQAEYNGSHVISVTSATAFTFIIATTPVSPATGTITAIALPVFGNFLVRFFGHDPGYPLYPGIIYRLTQAETPAHQRVLLLRDQLTPYSTLCLTTVQIQALAPNATDCGLIVFNMDTERFNYIHKNSIKVFATTDEISELGQYTNSTLITLDPITPETLSFNVTPLLATESPVAITENPGGSGSGTDIFFPPGKYRISYCNKLTKTIPTPEPPIHVKIIYNFIDSGTPFYSVEKEIVVNPIISFCSEFNNRLIDIAEEKTLTLQIAIITTGYSISPGDAKITIEKIK